MSLYTYPQTLDAMQKIATDLLAVVALKTQKRYVVNVIGDASASTASVQWEVISSFVYCTIRFPVKNPGAMVSAQEFADYAGYVFHEVGHPAYTDKQVWEAAVAMRKHRLLNALEDVRIEKALIDGGIAVNGRKVLTDLVRSLDYTAIKAGFDPNDPRKIGFVMGFLGRHANGYDMDAALITAKLVPGSAVSNALVWALPALAACQSTQDCLDLSIKLLATLPKKAPFEAPKTNPVEGEKEQGEVEQGDAPEAGETETVQGEAGETETETAEGEAPEGEAPEGEESPKAPKGKKAGGPEGEPEEEKLDDADVEEVDLTPQAGDYEAHSQDAETAAKVVKAIRQGAQTRKINDIEKDRVLVRDSVTMEQVAHKASRHRALLARSLKRNEEDLYEGGLRHGKLDRRAFAAMAAGSTTVMGRRSLVEGYETDVVVLVDCSGSMQGPSIRAASTLSLIIAQACSQVGVACSTYGFGCGYKVSERSDHGLVAIKQGKGKPEARKFLSMVESTGGSTPLCEALVAVANIQKVRAPGKRRVIFVVSDGGDNEGEEKLKGVANYVEDVMGAELANLMIGWQLLGAFRNEALIDPSKDIAEAGLVQLTRKLEKGVA